MFRQVIRLLSCAGLLSAQTYTISTYAGGAPPPTPIPATALSVPVNGVTVANGYVYLAAGSTVLQVDSTGLLTRLAGNGKVSYQGPPTTPVGARIAALNVQFGQARSLTADRAGNLYIIDDGQYVWKLTADGQIQAAAEIPSDTFGNTSSLATDPNGTLYLSNGPYVYRVGEDGSLTNVAGNGAYFNSGDGGPALQAGIGTVASIVFDASGNLYISSSDWDGDFDFTNARVRVVKPDGTIQAFAGTGVMGYSGDGGPAVTAQLGSSASIWIDGAGDIFIADYPNGLREVTPDGKISTVYQGRFGVIASVDAAGNPYIIEPDYLTPSVVRREPDGSMTPIEGGGSYIGDGGAATAATLNNPQGVAVDAAHNLYIADLSGWRIRKVTANGIITDIAGNGARRQAGDDVPEGIPAVTAQLFCPCQGIAADRNGNVYFTEWDRVRKISADGILTTLAAVPAMGLAFDGSSFYIADYQESRVWKLASDGTMTPFAGNGIQGHSGDGGPALNAQLQYPSGVALDGAGNVYIAEYLPSWGGWVRKVAPDGTINTLTLDRDMNGFAVDAAANIYIVDFRAAAVRKIAPNGTAATIAGGAGWGYSGDGGLAAGAKMYAPSGIAVDALGNLFVADTQNNAIRMIAPAPAAPGH
jgi:sugar lactone lactonase YvrE